MRSLGGDDDIVTCQQGTEDHKRIKIATYRSEFEREREREREDQ